MAKIRRNELCHCGSGRKYKYCHGSFEVLSDGSFSPTPDVRERIALEIERHNASEHRRRLMQGRGRPIVSFVDDAHGYRFVAIRSELRWSRTWLTFTDFLFDYIKFVLGTKWGTAELAKPPDTRHPLLGWYRKLCEFQQAHAASRKGDIYSGIATGAVRAYLGLAYDLYLCAHNAEATQSGC